jgi:hypothetical protein
MGFSTIPGQYYGTPRTKGGAQPNGAMEQIAAQDAAIRAILEQPHFVREQSAATWPAFPT